jgi:hypothetical protein
MTTGLALSRQKQWHGSSNLLPVLSGIVASMARIAFTAMYSALSKSANDRSVGGTTTGFVANMGLDAGFQEEVIRQLHAR